MAKKEKITFENIKGDLLNMATPKQKVVPVSVDKKEKTVLFNFYIPEKLRDELKMKALIEKTTATDLIIKALRNNYKL